MSRGMMTNRALRWFYTRLNKFYFGGLLPKPKVLKFGDVGDRRIAYVTVNCTCDGSPFEVKCLIISKRIQWARVLVIVSLLHEMAHINLFRQNIDHSCPGSKLRMGRKADKPFEKELCRLFGKGAYLGWL